MAKLTGSEMLEKMIKDGDRDIEVYRNDKLIIDGRIRELENRLDKMRNTCLYCASYIYNYGDTDRMATHVNSQHAEEAEREAEREAELIQS